MTENMTNKLLLEHLKAMQTKLVNLEQGQTDIKTTLIGMQQHMGGFMTSAASHESAIAGL